MVNIEATSPQLQLVKDLLEAYCDFDMEKVGELLSKDYKFKTLPKHPDHPDQTKEEHLESYGRKLSLMVQLDANVTQITETPGKVVTHVEFLATTADATKLEYDSVITNTFVEEGGKLKILENKDFSDSYKRDIAHGWCARALGR